MLLQSPFCIVVVIVAAEVFIERRQHAVACRVGNGYRDCQSTVSLVEAIGLKLCRNFFDP